MSSGGGLEAALEHDRAGRHQEAEIGLRQLIDATPADALLHAELGAVLAHANKLAEAEASYREALRLQPGFGVVHHNLGNALRDMGRLEEAEASYRRAAELMPEVPEVHYNRGIALRMLGRLYESERSYAAALACRPDFAEAHNNRGVVLADLGRWEEAEQSYQLALAARPDHAIAYSNLGNAQRQQGRIEEAERSYREALRLNPGLAAAHNHLANALRDLGRLEDAERSYRRALELNPGAVNTHSNLLFLLNYLPERSAQAIFSEHRAYGQRFARVPNGVRHPNRPDPARQLRVGYLSGDLRDHAVSYFLEPVLAGHKRGRCEIVCYQNNLRGDHVTERLKRLAHLWQEVAHLDDAALDSLIRRDRIDILVDLAGHTAQNRLPVFARRPAPLQATWLGYLNTTGLSAIDYRITDAVASPPGPLDALHSEQLIRLPGSQWCYQPPTESPEVAPRERGAGSGILFGVFTTPPKVNDRMIGLWREALDRVPGSRLLVVFAIVSTVPSQLQERFHRLGIGPERLSMLGSQNFERYLELHRSVDLMLDTAPYTGGTTTCHALWMGVPIVTLTGETATSRGGASLLRAAGLDELVADTSSHYVDLAARLASDRGRLDALRKGLRSQMSRSPLMDSSRFVVNLEVAYGEMWRRWCEKGEA
jgi:predicted O-linked N-acetylglucosamine transferase (SPINDLY family)